MPLILRRIVTVIPQSEREGAWGEYVVLSGNFPCGLIRRHTHGPTGERWEWNLNGISAGTGVALTRGLAGSLEEARLQFHDNWRVWLTWARATRD
jgi:hypothetical protein